MTTQQQPIQTLTPTDLARMEQQARAGQATPAMVLALVAEVRRARLTADTALALVRGGGR